ncbi:MAG: glycosyltransferase family 4 protein [Desulfobulbaceae bacterium]|nr:glycosyltransferase family 4 protein [Desulfobulbaceae bacterium]
MSSVNPLKIAFIRADYDPYGGAEKFTNVLMEELAAKGIEIHLFTRSWVNPQGSNFSIHHVGGFRNPSLIRHASFVYFVNRALSKYHFDLIHSNERTLSQTIYRAGDGVHARWLELRKKRVGVWKRFSLRVNPFHLYLCWLERKMFESQKLAAIIVNSKMVGKEITARFSVPDEKIHTIYNGVDLQKFNPAHKIGLGTDFRKAAGVEMEIPVALMVGSGYERKGVHQLLKAMKHTPIPLQLWIVGKDSLGPYQEKARRLGLGERVKFWGKQDDVQPFYAAANFFVLPTLYDPFPSVALEAMASGLPIIVSKQCGAAEVIRQGREGFVVDTPDDEHLIYYMQVMVDKYHEMSGAARLCAEQFPITRTVQELISLYSHLLRKEKRGMIGYNN